MPEPEIADNSGTLADGSLYAELLELPSTGSTALAEADPEDVEAQRSDDQAGPFEGTLARTEDGGADDPAEAREAALRELPERFSDEARTIADYVRRLVATGTLSREEATRAYSATLMASDPAAREIAGELLREIAEPSTLIEETVRAYARFGDYQRHVRACTVLQEQGQEAFLALRAVSERRGPECRLFLDAMLGLEGVPDIDRVELLRPLADHPSHEVRELLVEGLEEKDFEGRESLLEALSSDEDEDLAERARDLLAEIA